MGKNARGVFSPFQVFTKEEWAGLRAGTPLTLSEDELEVLSGLNDPVSMEEVVQIYLPLSRLLLLYVEATQGLFQVTEDFLAKKTPKTPFIIGLAGSVAVGKSTTGRLLKTLLARWPSQPRVELVTTDGFLYPNALLEARGLMQRKGWPESYDLAGLTEFLANIKAGKRAVSAPVYSHLSYDIVADQTLIIRQPDILIVEGLNVLYTGVRPVAMQDVPFVSDFFDFSVFIDADVDDIGTWYVERFMQLRKTAFRKPQSYFHRYSDLDNEQALATARQIWNDINLPNLMENILPTRQRADLILLKGHNHHIEQVALRKL